MGTLSKYDLSGAIGIEVALHEIVVALEPRFFLNMRPTKASMGSQLGNMLTIVAKTWVLYHAPRFNVVLPATTKSTFLRSPIIVIKSHLRTQTIRSVQLCSSR